VLDQHWSERAGDNISKSQGMNSKDPEADSAWLGPPDSVSESLVIREQYCQGYPQCKRSDTNADWRRCKKRRTDSSRSRPIAIS